MNPITMVATGESHPHQPTPQPFLGTAKRMLIAFPTELVEKMRACWKWQVAAFDQVSLLRVTNR